MKVTKSTKPTEKKVKEEVPAAQPVSQSAPEPQPVPVAQEVRVKPTIVIKAQPITTTPQMVQRQSNQVILFNMKTGKRTPMGITQATKWANKYPTEFKVL
jgi:hypothetical protein